MVYNPQIHHRHSVRLRGYDYAQSGSCFITICTQNRRMMFGDIVDGTMELNDAGKMIEKSWVDIPEYYSTFDIDIFQIMPNHFHGIIHVGVGQAQGPAPTVSLPDIMNRFKTITTKRYVDGVKQNGWQPFSGKLWQRNYYEHVIRDDVELYRIREYIQNNPLNWQTDSLYGL